MDAAPKGASDEGGLEEAFAEPRGLGFDGPPPSIDELVAAEDAAGLLELGATYRVGAPHVTHDLFKAVECFEAASRLGSEQAEYLVGLAYMNGLGVEQDLAEGAKRLRSAAQRGSLRAKVYVANLYELGIHYALDEDKADVWYRNVARAAGIEGDPEGDEYELAMAELGCVRYCLRIVADDDLPTKDRAFYLKKAKAMGYAHRLSTTKRPAEAAEVQGLADALEPEAPPDEATETDGTGSEAAEAEAPRAEAQRGAEGEQEEEEAEEEDEDLEPGLGGQWTFGRGLLAFSVATFFAASGSACAFLATEGSRALWLADRPIPLIGRMHEVVLFAVLLLAGVLPAASVYRPKVVAIAAVIGAAAGAGGWYLHAQMPWLWDAPAQAGAAGMAGFLIVSLFLGVLGGTRLGSRGRG